MADSAELMETLSHDDVGEATNEDQHSTTGMSNGALPGYSSIETLLLNIQGLLKVAGENARHQERQICKCLIPTPS
ncbi:DACH1-like protein [Mya arenaria]|uniref:DACH1-like protein n=1 Tax=Mya arenaria TaxID=6604 RepID=A0ABY7DN46_MYAAR|nr:DACH1-like protein [Mya arenaria]